MAGAYWHFYTANRTIERLKEKLEKSETFSSIVEHPLLFLAGAQGPDFNFYPGGDARLSSLAHGKKPADLGREMLRLSTTARERAFAYGWLMHLTTDTITHPLVNRFILSYFPRQTQNGTDPFAYPLGHHRVEWGIDVHLLQNDQVKPYLPDPMQALVSAFDVYPLVKQAYRMLFSHPVSVDDWKGGIKGMIRYLSLFENAWKLTGRIKDRNFLKQSLKSIGFRGLVTPLAKLIALRNPENGAGVFIPISPKSKDIEQVLDHAEQVCPVFSDYLDNDFLELPNHTG